MTTKIQKWGNSLGVRLPKELARECNFRKGSAVSFSIEGEAIVLRRLEGPKYSLGELLKKANKKNLHPEYDWGKSVGKEI